MSAYSVRGFEDPEAKHTTTFEAKIPEARDPVSFPHCRERPSAYEAAGSTASPTKSGPYLAADGFVDNSGSTPNHSTMQAGQPQPAYTANGFKSKA